MIPIHIVKLSSKNAWFEVKLPNSVEIDRINIYNRKGNKEERKISSI